jgi:hypothetical protein
MSKGYVKDSNGKYRLVDKDQDPIVVINQQQSGPLCLEELDVRLKRLESIVLDPRK